MPVAAPPSVRPAVLIVRDGWGRNPHAEWDRANAVKLARTPVADRLDAEYPHTLIHTSGHDVGLPEGTMGNSEVGHQNLGAGRIVDQESVRITKQARDGTMFDNPELVEAVDRADRSGGKLHLFGIVSDAGVHGQLEHLYALLALCKKRGLERVFLHAFTDGRDTPPNSGIEYLGQVESHMADLGVGRVATVSGRYWAMDRDDRWGRVEKAYRAIAAGEGPTFDTAVAAVKHYYDHPAQPTMAGDEFVTPSVILADDGNPVATVADGDSVIFYNYRGDRPREITKAFVLDDFAAPDGFDRGKKLDLYFVTMTAYEKDLPVHVAYAKPPKMTGTLGEYIASLGLKQFRCAETEKFPHVTFFFNDYRDAPWPGEDRHMAQSPKDVATYDLKPEMAAAEVRDLTMAAVASGDYALVVVNFANGDMVGHTGNLPAATRACEVVDAAVGQILDAAHRAGAAVVVTADHGNAEQMIDPSTGGPHTAHTTYDVQVVVVDDGSKGKPLRPGGRLADIAPTLLDLMGLAKPSEMTGRSLLEA